MIQAPGETLISKQEEGEDYYNHISMLKQSILVTLIYHCLEMIQGILKG